MIRLIVTSSYFHQGTGCVETEAKSFDLELPEIEKMLREGTGTYSSVGLTYELLQQQAVTQVQQVTAK